MVSKTVLVLALVVLAVVIEAKMTNKIRKNILKQQNKVRSTVAKGKFANGSSGSNLPKASNMVQLTYSKKLEKKATKAAKLCILNVTGANVYVGSGTVKPAAGFKNATATWKSELSGNTTLPSLTYSSTNSSAYRNLTQLIWATTKQVGCGSATCSNVTGSSISGSATLFVCQYKAPGNVDGKVIYKSGKPTKKCPKKTKKVKKTGLCKQKGKQIKK